MTSSWPVLRAGVVSLSRQVSKLFALCVIQVYNLSSYLYRALLWKLCHSEFIRLIISTYVCEVLKDDDICVREQYYVTHYCLHQDIGVKRQINTISI